MRPGDGLDQRGVLLPPGPVTVVSNQQFLLNPTHTDPRRNMKIEDLLLSILTFLDTRGITG